MNIKHIFYLIFMHFFSFTYGQHNTNYFDNVLKAELFLCDSNWQSALSFYEKAINFKKNDSYSFDIHNALVCSILLNKYKKAAELSKKLIIKGCNLYYFDKPIFVKFKESREWQKLIKDSTMLKIRSKKKINNYTKNIIDSMYIIDQNKTLVDRKNIFLENALKLKDIIKANGYPSENITGIYLEHAKFFIDRPSVMIFHLLSYNRDDIALIPILYKKTIEGELHPAYFAWLPFKEKKYQYSKNGNNVITIANDSIYIFSPNIKQLLEYNNNRKKINLPDLDTFKKITLFYYKDKRFIHPIDGRISIIDFANEESKKNYLKDYKKYVSDTNIK